MTTVVQTLEEKILKWCGFKIRRDKSPDPVHELLRPDGEQENIWYAGRDGTGNTFDEEARQSMSPTLDMNFFFKYVVPKLDKGDSVSVVCGSVAWVTFQIHNGHPVHYKEISAWDKDSNKAWQEALGRLIDDR